MPLKKITEILKELKESLPVDIQENYKNIFIAKNVTAILEARGLLRKSENGGRYPTQAGRETGISTEPRTNQDTGEEYLQVLYNEAAIDYVRSMLFEEYPEISPVTPGGYTITTLPAVSGAGRKTIRSIIKNHNVEIALVKHHDKYWTYDKTALELCRIIGANPHKTFAGKYGSAIKCDDFISFVIPVLMDNGVDFAINDETLEIHRKTTALPSTPIARVGSAVTLQDALGETINVYLAESEIFILKPITHPDGTIEIIRVPVTEKDGYQILHPDTPLFDDVFGKQKDDVFCHNDFTYKIINIRNDINL